jgi:hypothetical protein
VNLVIRKDGVKTTLWIAIADILLELAINAFLLFGLYWVLSETLHLIPITYGQWVIVYILMTVVRQPVKITPTEEK